MGENKNTMWNKSMVVFLKAISYINKWENGNLGILG